MLLVKLLVAADDELADPLKLPARREEKKKIVRNESRKKLGGGGWMG